jgi:hypothetical protein
MLALCLTLALSLLGASAHQLATAQEPVTTVASAVLLGRIVAVGIPGAGALSPVGAFHPGGPIHDKPDFAAFTRPGAMLDPTRLLVASTSNFGAPLAQPHMPPGAILSLDPRTTTPLVVPPTFASGDGQATALDGCVQLLTANSPAFVNRLSNPQAVTGALAPVAAPRGISLNNAFGRPWFANTPAGLHGAGVESVVDPEGRPFAGAPHQAAGGVFTGPLLNRQPQQAPGALIYGAVGNALLGKSPDGSGRAVFAVALADGSLVQVHVEHGVDGLAPAGTIGALYNVEHGIGSMSLVTRVGVVFNWVPDRILYVTDPVHHAVAVLTLVDDGSIFRLQQVRHLVNTDLNVPVDVAPAVPEIANPGFASNTTLAGGSDLYVANRGNGSIVRLRQDGTVIAVRQVAVPGLGPLGTERLNGLAVSPDATRLWVTVSGTLPEFPQADGIVVELPAFGAPVVSRN